MHHIKQCETTIQIALFWCRPNFPCQQASSSTTVFDITHWMSNMINTMYHKSKVRGQWIRRWSTDSPFFLHKQHQSKIQIFCFQRLSIVKIFPKAAVQTKKKKLETLGGTLGFLLWNFKVLASVWTVPKYNLTRMRSNPQGLEWM